MTDDKKSVLALIGIGPGKVSSMTLEAVELARQADVRLYEAYTALWSGPKRLYLNWNLK